MQTPVILNPFVVGRYVSDHYFCDREEETEFLTKQVVNGRNVALISSRRMGKTGLIWHCFVPPRPEAESGAPGHRQRGACKQAASLLLLSSGSTTCPRQVPSSRP